MRSLLKLLFPAMALGISLILFVQSQAPAGLYA